MSDSNGSTDSLSERFQNGSSIDWSSIGNAAVGSTLMLVAMTIVDGFLLVQRGVSSLFDGVGWFLSSIVSLPFNRGAEIFEAGAAAFAGWVSVLGPLAFPVSVLVAIASLSAVLWGVSRLVRR